MRTERMHLSAALLLVGGVLGCSGGGGKVNIGDSSPIGSKLSDYAASWDGYAQAYSFWPNGSDRVRLTIDAMGQGYLRVGDAPLLPAPTDPDTFNPSNIVELPDWSNLVEGGLYPTHVVKVEAGRMQFGINPWDLEAAWCALQTPYPTPSKVTFSDGGQSFDYTCAPPASSYTGTCSYVGADLQSHPLDCAKAWLCTGEYACGCSATGCAGREVPDATSANRYPDEFDAALDSTGRTLTGTLNLDGNRITVVMQKQ